MNTIAHRSTAAVGYVRLSKSRKEQTTVASQKRAIEREAERRGIPLVAVFVDDGRSAYRSKAHRAGYHQALAMIAARQADTLIVWAVDRFSRDWPSAGTEFAKLKAVGGALVAIVDEVDTSTDQGEIEFGGQLVAAQRESLKKSQRGKAWHAERRETCLPPAGQPPVGYYRPRPNTLALDSDRRGGPAPIAGIVRDGVRAIVAGESSIRQLRLAIASAGRSVTQSGLVRSLRSPTIAGLVENGSGQLVEADWPALVDRATWEQLVELLADPARRTNYSNGDRRYTLAGIARCHCGGLMRVKPSTKGPTRLSCRTCEQSIIYGPVAEFVESETLRRLTPEVWATLRAQGYGRTINVDDYERRLAALRGLMDDRTIDEVEYADRLRKLKADVAATAAERIPLPDVADPAAEWGTLTITDRRLLLVAAIDSLVIAGGGLQSGSRVNLDRVGLRFVETVVPATV